MKILTNKNQIKDHKHICPALNRRNMIWKNERLKHELIKVKHGCNRHMKYTNYKNL